MPPKNRQAVSSQMRMRTFGLPASPTEKVPEETPVRGSYLVKTAVGTTAFYLAVQLLVSFADMLLPFIFAVLMVVILEPIKQYVKRMLHDSLILIFETLKWHSCVETKKSGYQSFVEFDEDPVDGRKTSHSYSRVPDDPTADSNSSNSVRGDSSRVLIPSVSKALLAISIIACLIMTGRVFWIIVKVFISAGKAISMDLVYYERRLHRMELLFRNLFHNFHGETLDWAPLLKDLVDYLQGMAEKLTDVISETLFQFGMGLIFILYLLWSPIRIDSHSLTRDVFRSAALYLKVKTLISAFTGVAVAITLWSVDIDLPAFFGLLAFICNFLPGIGSIVSSLLPCVLGAIDDRKDPLRVVLAFVLQLVLHIFIDYFIEPVFFGMSAEVHSVVIILGIAFFSKIWGVFGMLISVPLLAIVRLVLKSVKHANRVTSTTGGDADTVAMMDNILQGRWMSTVGATLDELPEYSIEKHAFEEGERPFQQSGDGVDWNRNEEHVSFMRSLWKTILDSKVGRETKAVYKKQPLCLQIMASIIVVVTLWIF